jgi:hypothetical protein
MKKFSKEQIGVMAVSFIAVVVLAFQVLTLDPSTSDEDLKSKYRSSVDSVLAADSLIGNFTKAEALKSKDIFNLKVVAVKKRFQESVATDSVRVAKTKWISSNDLELYTKDKISFSFFFNGKARFTINGKTQEVKVGDILTVGKTLSKEVIDGTNEPTGNTKTGKEYSNKILIITERAVYIDSDDKNRVIRYKPNADAAFFARNLMNTSSGDDKESTTEPAETPGRRPRR